MVSGLGIDHHGIAHNFFPEMPAQVHGRSQVDCAPIEKPA
jgi:hypothetical protein